MVQEQTEIVTEKELFYSDTKDVIRNEIRMKRLRGLS